MPLDNPQKRLTATNSVLTAASVTQGRYTFTTLGAATTAAVSAAVAQSYVMNLGMPGIAGQRFRGFEAQIIGTGADNSTATIVFWQLKYSQGAIDFELNKLGSLACIFSTAVGCSDATGSPVLTTERIADTLTWTNATTTSGIGDMGTTAYGSLPIVARNGSNTPGRLYVPDVQNGDVFCEMYLGTATGVNLVWEGIT